MIFKNLLRRKGRTLLTMMGIAIGAAAIVGLGALAEGLRAGYGAVLGSGSRADLVLSDPEAFDVILSSIDDDIGPELEAMPEVEAVSPLLQGLIATDDTPYLFIYGYAPDSFSMERFQIVAGVSIDSREAAHARGRPIMIGQQVAESSHKQVGDTFRLGDGLYRVVGIYETGDAFEEGGGVILLKDAQELLGMSNAVSLYYIKLEDPALEDRLRERVERLYPDLSLTTGSQFSEQSLMTASIDGMVWGIAALAILIGGVGMTNAQLMAITERTGEIGVLRAVGWKGRRVLRMILGESIIVSLLGGGLGVLIAWFMLILFKDALVSFGTTTALPLKWVLQAFGVVFLLGITSGLYPAYRASRLQPVEALRYEGGSTGEDSGRLPFGGMALQNLWRRKSRTLLTFTVIAITVGAVVALDAILKGSVEVVGGFAGGAEIVVRQRDAADSSLAVIDENIGDRIAAMPEVRAVSGFIITATLSPDLGIFMIQGYAPREPGIEKFNVVEGERISTNRQIMIGRAFADSSKTRIGDTIELSGMRFKVVGIYESGYAWEELGGVTTLRDAQTFAGRPRQVSFFTVHLYDLKDADQVIDRINAGFPEVAASLSADLAETLPDMKASFAMADGIALMAILVGGVGMMNTMLMAVLERTREIGVLRALGWRRRKILNLIMNESVILGIIGALIGTLLGFIMGVSLQLIPVWGEAILLAWPPVVFLRASIVAVTLGVLGGFYPALRATRLQPVEALRYE